MSKWEFFKNLERAQESVHATERNLLLLEKKLLDLTGNGLVNSLAREELEIILEGIITYRILVNKIWRDLLVEYGRKNIRGGK